MKKRIKTRRLTNIYHSEDDDVGDGSKSAILSLSLSFGPSPSSQYIYQQSQRAKIFEHSVRVALAIGYIQKRISLTLLLL